MRGRILKGVGGVYYVRDEQDTVHVCFARGRFRKQKIKPLVGDYVEFQPQKGEEDGYLLEILPRKNALRRPLAANIDLLLIVMAAVPEPDWLLCDRLLSDAAGLGVEAAVVFNKRELAPDGGSEALAVYRHLPFTCSVSAERKEGLEELKAFLAGKTFVLAGQSGVGKSSLLNALLPEASRETGSLSEKISRGKNTTRHSELLDLGNGCFAVDTPGFSLLESETMEPTAFLATYPDFAPYADRCRFAGCLHDREAGCALREAVEAGEIPKERYERYRVLLSEVRELWRNRYNG